MSGTKKSSPIRIHFRSSESLKIAQPQSKRHEQEGEFESGRGLTVLDTHSQLMRDLSVGTVMHGKLAGTLQTEDDIKVCLIFFSPIDSVLCVMLFPPLK